MSKLSYHPISDEARANYTGQETYNPPSAGPQQRCTWCVQTLALLNGGGTILDNGLKPTRQMYPHLDGCPHKGKF